MGLVNLTFIHLEWLDMRNSSATVTILLISDDLSLHDTCANNISSISGSKLAADILRRQEEASSAARSRKTLRLTWQFEVCYSKSSPFNRYHREHLRDGNTMPWQ